MSRPWMPLYVADYLRDTRKLTAAEHGAYLLLIMEYWTAGTLPEDDRQLARIASMSTSEWKRARPNIEGFFHDGWKHKRLDAELARSAEISSKRAASAKQRHSNSSSNAHANAEQLDTHAGATSQSQPQLQTRSSLRSETRGARATRLADDWIPSEADLAFAVGRGLSIAQIETEALKFRNHWTSKSGKDATKTNWQRTWENWILNIRGAPNHGHGTGNSRASGHDAILAVASRKARELDRNDEMARPAGAPGFAFGDGADGAGSDRGRGAAEADRGDRQRQEPDDQRVREGEIIPPDQDAFGVPRGRQFV